MLPGKEQNVSVFVHFEMIEKNIICSVISSLTEFKDSYRADLDKPPLARGGGTVGDGGVVASDSDRRYVSR